MLKKVKKLINNINSSISSQLTFTLLGVFILIIALSSMLIYTNIVNILDNNYEKNSIDKFKQYNYNINTFMNGVDLISRQLVLNANIQELTGYKSLPENERTILNSSAFRAFSQVLSNYKYIDSIAFYSSEGLALKASANRNDISYEWVKGQNRFESQEYDNIVNNSKKLVWLGGYSSSHFNVYSDNSDYNRFFITAARAIFSGSQNSILMININLKYFTSIYNFYGEENESNAYIINSSGIILSHKDESLIGKKSRIYKKLKEGVQIESFSATEENAKLQVVYYRLDVPDWILVNEVPAKVIQKDITILRNVVLLIFLIGIVIVAILSRYWIYKITKPLKQLTGTMKKIEYGRLGITLEVPAKNELGILINQFNNMSVSIKDLINRNSQIQDEKSKIEMKALQSQINPHFIYNTLNTIKWMAVISKADNVAESLSTLSELLNPVFKSNDVMCTLHEEISYIKNYVKIMNYRFAGGFKIIFDTPDELLDCNILRFILQPLVENAISHGLMNQNGGEIQITAWKEDKSIFIKVSDNGEGLSEEKLGEINKSLENDINIDENAGIGLANVNRRIQLHFGKGYGLKINSKYNSGTEVILRLCEIKSENSFLDNKN